MMTVDLIVAAVAALVCLALLGLVLRALVKDSRR
jgi:hypothetical protein